MRHIARWWWNDSEHVVGLLCSYEPDLIAKWDHKQLTPWNSLSRFEVINVFLGHLDTNKSLKITHACSCNSVTQPKSFCSFNGGRKVAYFYLTMIIHTHDDVYSPQEPLKE